MCDFTETGAFFESRRRERRTLKGAIAALRRPALPGGPATPSVLFGEMLVLGVA